MRHTKLRSGEMAPVLAQGTWGMAEKPRNRAAEIAALRLGLDLGMTLIAACTANVNIRTPKISFTYHGYKGLLAWRVV